MTDRLRLLFSGLLLLTLTVAALLLAAQSVTARPPRQAGDILAPAAEPYVLGFADLNSVPENWRNLTGDWVLENQRYVQNNLSAVNAASLYRLGIADIYTIEVTLARVAGEAGGVIIGAPANDALTFANVVRYNYAVGALEIGDILADGTFNRLAAVTAGIPQDDADHLLRIEVDGTRFRVFFDETEIGDYALTNRPPVAFVGVYANLGRFTFADFTAQVGAGETIGGDLNPQPQPHIFDFATAAALDEWRPGAGTWTFGDPGYRQASVDEGRSFSYYAGRINGDFALEVTLSALAETMGGGLLFNAAGNAAPANTMLVAFDPAAEVSGGALIWGYFDGNGVYQQLGTTEVAPPANATDSRRLGVTLTDNAYTLTVDGQPVGGNLTLPAEVARVAGPYFGLYTADSQANFARVAVTVTEVVGSTPTPIVATDTPTPTPSPTATQPPPAGSLLPRNEPYVFNFGDMNDDEKTQWPIERGAWSFGDSGYTQTDLIASDAMVFYRFRVYGDYEFEAKFLYAGGEDIPADAGGGIIFNAPNQAQNEAFVASFRRDETQSAGLSSEGRTNFAWGYFRTGNFIRLGQTTVANTPLNKDVLRTVRVKVEGGNYSIWLDTDNWVTNRPFFVTNSDGSVAHDTTRQDQAFIGLYAHKGVIRFESARVTVSNYANPTPTPTVTSPPTPTRGPTPTPDANALPQSPDPFAIGFSPATSGQLDSTANWNPVQGTWSYNQGYVNSAGATSAEPAFSVFNRAVGQVPAGGDYTFETTVQYVDGEMGGGIFFNAPGRTSLDQATLLRFKPDPVEPQVEWGYFTGGTFRSTGNSIAPSPGQVKSKPYRLRVSVTSEHYSLWVDGQQLVESQLLDPTSRHLQPFVGVYAADGRVRFTDAVINVTQQNLPTGTPTPTSPPTNPTRTLTPTTGPSRTPTPTYTVTPGSPTPTNTPPPGTPTNTPTPIVIGSGAAQPTATPVLAFSTPLPATPNARQIAETAAAATVTMESVNAQTLNSTATAQALFDLQTATALAASPLATPDMGGAFGQTGMEPTASTTPPPANDPAPDSPLVGVDADGTHDGGQEVAMIVVTNTPTSTPRPIEAGVPAAPAGQSGGSLTLFTQIFAASARAIFWIWFILGSIVFFAVAGLIFGLSISRQSDDPFALYDTAAADDLAGLPSLDERNFDTSGAGRVATTSTRNQPDDNWPPSLP